VIASEGLVNPTSCPPLERGAVRRLISVQQSLRRSWRVHRPNHPGDRPHCIALLRDRERSPTGRFAALMALKARF
jgi:hypothetical protein